MPDIGFTGTQLGMTDVQQTQLFNILMSLEHDTFHHGLCIGADEQAHHIVKALSYKIIGHPPTIQSKMMTYDPQDFHYIFTPKPYLSRNYNIAHQTDLLIAAPKEQHEILRSGTWSTIRYAKKLDRPIVIIRPDGNITRIN